MTSNGRLTKRPSANQAFKKNITSAVRLSGLESMNDWYPSGPVGATLPTLVYLRLSMEMRDRLLRVVAVSTVTAEKMRAV